MYETPFMRGVQSIENLTVPYENCGEGLILFYIFTLNRNKILTLINVASIMF